ncbi:MAG: hypothetical protein ACYTDY_07805 [Planctomycetota bacterium]
MMGLRVVVRLRTGGAFELDRSAGYTDPELRAAFRILRRGIPKQIVQSVHLFDGEQEIGY